MLGRYVVDSWVRDGGMASLYRGHHTRTGAQVAIKVQRTGEESRAVISARFEREAEVMGRLAGHHSVAHVHDLAELPDGRRYLVMEWVGGTNLEEFLDQLRNAEKTISLSRACGLLLDVAHGLAAAHERGVVHRDLNPSNIMIEDEGADREHAKLIDFGISADLDAALDAPELTATGLGLGTSGYMAPEQTLGLAAHPGFDLYAFGIVSFEVLTGLKAPPSGRGPRRLPSVDEIRPSVPVAWSALIAECLDPNPKLRPESAGEVIERLAAVGRTLASEGVPPPKEQPELAVPPPNVRERPKLAALSPSVQEQPELAAPPPSVRERPELAASPPSIQTQPKPAAPPPGVQTQPKPAAPLPGVQTQPKPAAPPPSVQEQPELAALTPSPKERSAPQKKTHFAQLGWWFVVAGVVIMGIVLIWRCGIFPPVLADKGKVVASAENPANSAETTSAEASLPGTADSSTSDEPSTTSGPYDTKVSYGPDTSSDGASTSFVPEPAKPTRPRRTTSRSKPNGSSHIEAPENSGDTPSRPTARPPRACQEARDAAQDALRGRRWKVILEHTSAKRCWSSRAQRIDRTALRVKALAELARYRACVDEGAGSIDPSIARVTRFCRSQLDRVETG